MFIGYKHIMDKSSHWNRCNDINQNFDNIKEMDGIVTIMNIRSDNYIFKGIIEDGDFNFPSLVLES